MSEKSKYNQLRDYIHDGVVKGEISRDLWREFLFITENRDRVRQYLLEQARQEINNRFFEAEDYVKRPASYYCTKEEWEYSPTGELFEVMMLIEYRANTEMWWRKKIAEEQGKKN